MMTFILCRTNRGRLQPMCPRYLVQVLSAIVVTLTISHLLQPQVYATTSDDSTSRPNILLILADDLGYGDLSCYNPEAKVQTPNIDRLAREGMRFTDAHSPSTVCTPTRYSILTGQMAFRLNYRGVFTGAGGPCLITEDRLTLPGMLQARGYETALFGKWHVGLTFRDKTGRPIHKNGLDAVERIDYSRAIDDGPIHRGFDHFFGTACCPTTDWLYAFVDGDRVTVPPNRKLDRSTLPKHEWSFDCRPGWVADGFDLQEVDLAFLDKSLQFLDRHARENADQPFFLFHSLQAVHLPSFPGAEFQGKSNAGPHGDFILEMDQIVGRLLQKLEQLELTQDTLVLFTSDNGPEVGTVLNMRERYSHDGARPWRGMKRDNWEGGHRVPMIARWPGQIESHAVNDHTMCLTDLMATCASLVDYDLPVDAAEDSFDFLPSILGESSQPPRNFTLHQTMRLELAIRQGKWKYLDHVGSGGNDYGQGKLRSIALPDSAPDAPAQLYDLEADPGETNNLYLQRPEIAKALKQKLEQFKSEPRSAPFSSKKATETRQ